MPAPPPSSAPSFTHSFVTHHFSQNFYHAPSFTTLSHTHTHTCTHTHNFVTHDTVTHRTCQGTLRDRRGTCGAGLGLVERLVALDAGGTLRGTCRSARVKQSATCQGNVQPTHNNSSHTTRCHTTSANFITHTVTILHNFLNLSILHHFFVFPSFAVPLQLVFLPIGRS